ncbi:MAG: hypothetical protein E6248_07670 [Clostridium sp.]|uniref:hypothetical protein n=1 Tax=Clostridium sp. TaxID=1506 RepID=UPI002909086B|nr:hypothetical protein [Clostridium sp.]MDU5110311.1 hypothetical protein [Clostridium sp.]
MFISIPKEFFVPVLFKGDFKFNNENNNMEYNYERKSVEYNEVLVNNISRDYLSDTINLDEDEELRHDEEFTKNYFENIKDKEIEEQIIKYIYGFMRFIEELKEANCLGNNEKESTNLVNKYARKFKDVYNMYKNEVLRVRRPLTPGDIDAFINYYIGKISDIYNENLAELNCKTLNYDSIEAVIDDILNDARNILRDQIENLNCILVNKRVECKSSADVEALLKNSGNIYNKIDNEYVNATINM